MTKFAIDRNRELLTSQIALQRIGTPEDIADPMVFLASDAARYITGTSLEISGGKFCVQNPNYPWMMK
jgi:3-oxoacyl-[acyl-carrier protein] reductase